MEQQEITTMVDFEIVNGVARITLNRPEKYNSFVREMAKGVQERLKEARDNSEVRAIVITGAGKAFCAGQDLDEAISKDNGIDISKILVEHFNPIIIAIRELEKPVIAAVNGVAAGAGANIAFACDICLASEKASFIQAFSKIGLIPDSGGTYFLPRMIGLQRATALMMLGDKVKAQEAFEMGMVYKVFPVETFESSVMEIANRLASMPTMALGYTKRALNYSLTNDLYKQLGIEDQLQTMASETEDYDEGVTAFLEKRKPNFKGA